MHGDAAAWATAVFPANELILNTLKKWMYEWDQQLDQGKPSGFPPLP